jgi:hypothetical protein
MSTHHSTRKLRNDKPENSTAMDPNIRTSETLSTTESVKAPTSDATFLSRATAPSTPSNNPDRNTRTPKTIEDLVRFKTRAASSARNRQK